VGEGRAVLAVAGPVRVRVAHDHHVPRLSDAAFAAALAEEAGRALLSVRERLFDEGAFPWDVGDAGDLYAHRLITRRIAERFPADAVLSEEGHDDPRRLASERTWIVDPLDGTREYGEGRPDWAVHIALVGRTGEIAAAAVALPALGRVFATSPPAVVPPVTPTERAPRMVVSRSRSTWTVASVRAALAADVFPLGSAGAKAMAVVAGDADVYVHTGGLYEWDSAAPAGVAMAAGLHASRVDGSPLRYNNPDPWVPDLVICRPELADRVLEAVDRPPGR
jgi:3'(2'), 5'-bisphosphate nucleotidase